MLGLAILAIGIGAGFAPSARAATTVVPVQYGDGIHSITCYARITDALWPQNGPTGDNARYVYCGKEIASLPANPTQADLQTLGVTSLNAFLSLQSQVTGTLNNKSVAIIVFKDINQRYAAFGLTPPSSLAAQPSSSDYVSFPPKIYIYEQSPAPVNLNEVAFNSKHEAGHQYQHYQGAGYLANSGKFVDFAAIDFQYMDLKTPGNTYRTTYAYWLKKYNQATRVGYEELFAEEFALSENLPGSTPSSTKPVDPILRDNFKCTSAYVNAQRQRGQDPVQADFDKFNTPSDPNVYARCVPTPPTCTPYGVIGASYPVDGVNAFICFSPVVTARRDSLFNTIKLMPFKTGTQSDKAWDVLKSAGVKVFYFKNKAQANSYFSTTAPYNTNSGLTVIEDIVASNEECGHTSYGYKSTGQQIVIAAYDECSVATNDGEGGYVSQTLNPSLYWTATHQTGHAYDFALASRKTGTSRSLLPSDASGFTNLFNNTDTPNLIPGAKLVPITWDSWNDSQKNNHICAVFGPPAAPLSPSAIEISTGANAGPVCDSIGNPLSGYKWPGGKDPLVIAKEKIPFFLTSKYANRELWAQEFAEYVAYISGDVGQPYFKFSDLVIKNGSSTPRFVCTRAVLNNYVLNGVAPTTLPAGCPASPGPLN